MGAWDIGPFDNDESMDWLAELADTDDTDAALLESTLRAVVDLRDPYLEALEAWNGLAAAEMVAALRGHTVKELEFPEEASVWVEEHRGLDVSELVPLALTVVERVKADSELKELWEASPNTANWLTTLDDLSARLKAKPVKR